MKNILCRIKKNKEDISKLGRKKGEKEKKTWKGKLNRHCRLIQQNQNKKVHASSSSRTYILMERKAHY